MSTVCVDTAIVEFEIARNVLTASGKVLGSESIPLSDALGRIAAENIVADEDLVPYPRSAMDGYALRAADTVAASSASPPGLPVIGNTFAGDGRSTLTDGSAMGITTGAPVPFHADAVVPHERVSVKNGTIFIENPLLAGDCIFPPAEDVRRDEIVLRRGSLLNPGIMALLAFMGRAELAVYRKPRVAVLCTGSELVDVCEKPSCGQVRNSNAYALVALLSGCGVEARYLGAVVDKSPQLRSALETGREGTDLLITTGGASVGERDLIKAVLEEMGAEFEFRKVAVRPGKPFAFGWWRGLPVCVLPGNPSAAFACFHEFVRPLVLRMAGRENVELPVVKATLAGQAKSKPGSRYILFAKLSVTRFGFLVEPLENQCSALVRNPAAANALIVLPEGQAKYESGDQVDVQVLDWDGVLCENRRT